MEMILPDTGPRLLQEPGTPEVEIVWSPRWNRSKLSERGKGLLSAWGIAV